MLPRLVHRGPDDEGEVQAKGSWLGHRRLSIVDVEGGHQPLVVPDQDMWLVGNGEVYNHEEVRAELEDRPYSTRSDNEVALHLLREEGPDALGRLEGMFAFLCAKEDGNFLAARDPVGIKPLYWAQRRRERALRLRDRGLRRGVAPARRDVPPGRYWTPESGLVRFARAVPRRRARAGETEEIDARTHEEDLRDTRETLRCVDCR